jgi:hypothetical protein
MLEALQACAMYGSVPTSSTYSTHSDASPSKDVVAALDAWELNNG